MSDNVINPGAGPVHIPDVDAFLAGVDEEPMIDLGGGMIVPLREVLEGHDVIPVRPAEASTPSGGPTGGTPND